MNEYGICFTPGAITVVTGLLGVLASAVGVLYRQTVVSANARIAESQAREEIWRREATRTAAALGELLKRQPSQSGGS